MPPRFWEPSKKNWDQFCSLCQNLNWWIMFVGRHICVEPKFSISCCNTLVVHSQICSCDYWRHMLGRSWNSSNAVAVSSQSSGSAKTLLWLPGNTEENGNLLWGPEIWGEGYSPQLRWRICFCWPGKFWCFRSHDFRPASQMFLSFSSGIYIFISFLSPDTDTRGSFFHWIKSIWCLKW